MREADCEDENPCTGDFCVEGACQNTPRANGEPPLGGDEDIPGDCMRPACQDGQPISEADDGDLPDDPNGGDCTVPTCTDGTPGTGPREAGQNCDAPGGLRGVCNDMEVCSCAPPSPDAEVFVDGTDGVDDATHGGGPGGCAYRTLSYALTQATGRINLRDTTYDSANTTFPITLTANQWLNCELDNDQRVTTINGTAGAVIQYTGTSNGVRRCNINGGGTAGVCISVTTAGMGNDQHWIENTQVTQCDVGIDVSGMGDNFFADRSDIQNNPTVGVQIIGADKNGYLRENTFGGNGTDITCTDPSPGFNGDTNGGPSCMTCQNCPF